MRTHYSLCFEMFLIKKSEAISPGRGRGTAQDPSEGLWRGQGKGEEPEEGMKIVL
jgi:hypothetical protein